MQKVAFPDAENQWPVITDQQQTEDGVQLALTVTPSLRWFEGHFPGHPVLPGVVQLLWAENLVRHFYPDFSDTYQLKNLKFNRMVLPGAKLTLNLSFNREKRRLKFIYRQGGESCSSGTLEGKPT